MAKRLHIVSNNTRIAGMPINVPILHAQTQARWLGLPSKKPRKRAVIANPRKSNSRANAQSPPYTSNCQPDIFGALLTNGWIASPARRVSCTKQQNFQSAIAGFTCLSTDLMPLYNSILSPFFQSVFSEKDESHMRLQQLFWFLRMNSLQ